MTSNSFECCILGAGPAGLGAAIELIDNGVRDLVIIERNNIVGGLARTEQFGNLRFDVGPHRFFTKNSEIENLWHETLGDDFRLVSRLTRILYNQKLFRYPVSPIDTLSKLGVFQSTLALLSFLNAKINVNREILTFEDWLTDKFGERLYRTFFKTYTEKVWGIPCNEIGQEFAEQRIKGLDIIEILKSALLGKSNAKSLVDHFHYPIFGAGQMYEAWAEKLASSGATIITNSEVIAIHRDGGTIKNIEILVQDKNRQIIDAKHFFSSIPITTFFDILRPKVPAYLGKAISTLYYRDHITVNLSIGNDNLFPDQWIYVHDPDVRMARITNYNNFSSSMVPERGLSALSVEYFAFQSEEIWKMNDESLVELAIEEICRAGLVNNKSVNQGWVVRETESYPTYFIGYHESYNELKNTYSTLHNMSPIGRGGMYRYNNQDHSTYSGILAARNYTNVGGAKFDVWALNTDLDYQEEIKPSSR